MDTAIDVVRILKSSTHLNQYLLITSIFPVGLFF